MRNLRVSPLTVNYTEDVSKQSGQSLIETIVAIFILVTGLSAGLALAIFAFGSATEIAEQITATGLAREGLESVRRMRDTNWRADELTACDNIGDGQQCYQDWLREVYNIRGNVGDGRDYRLQVNSAITNDTKWRLQGNQTDYRLYNVGSRVLNHNSNGQSTNLFRKITIIHQNTNNPANETQVLVRSSVWWHGKRCNNSLTNLTNPDQTNCKVISEEFLTNWRNY